MVAVRGARGGSRGRGLAMCKAFYEAGASVAVAARRPDVNEESVAESKAGCPARPGQQVIPGTLDVTDAANVEAAYNEVINSFGKLDILVNNAGRSAGGAGRTTRPRSGHGHFSRG